MNIYLMGSSSELALCKDYMKRLRANGHTIAHDWVADVEREGGGNPATLPDEVAAEYATTDLDSADRADIHWFLLPITVTRGAWVEFGYVLKKRRDDERNILARPKSILVSGNFSQSIFTRLATNFFPTHEEAFAWLTRR
jgi:hypothetical protein